MAVSVDGRIAVSGDADGTARVLDLADDQEHAERTSSGIPLEYIVTPAAEGISPQSHGH